MGKNLNDLINLKLQVGIQPKVRLDFNAHQFSVNILNVILADEAVLSLKTRNAHWNTSGPGFFDRHNLFGVQYKQLNDISDEISKRILVLGGLPFGSFEEFLKNTRLDEQPGIVPDLMDLLTDHQASIRLLREDSIKCSDEFEDEVTRDFLVDILGLHEKMARELRLYIEPQLIGDEGK